jgi:tRNA nucleotidyltransferase/poly(A) polymerase
MHTRECAAVFKHRICSFIRRDKNSLLCLTKTFMYLENYFEGKLFSEKKIILGKILYWGKNWGGNCHRTKLETFLLLYLFAWQTQKLLHDIFFVKTGANPTTENYNASAAEIYNSASSLVRFENKNSFVYLKKRSILSTTTLALQM